MRIRGAGPNLMGTAFYSEAQIWPWIRDSRDELVMFAMHWTDDEDLVCHGHRPDCPREEPHRFGECGAFMGRERERQRTRFLPEEVTVRARGDPPTHR